MFPPICLRNEFNELFDTTPDLTGADLDISRFIRTGDERDVQVFWQPIPKDKAPNDDLREHRSELCSVPFLKCRDWLCGSETKSNRKPKLRGGMRAWIWDWLDGKWLEAKRENLIPGRVVLVDALCGGYDPASGFDPDSKHAVPPVKSMSTVSVEESTNADQHEDGEDLSHNPWKTIACHSQEVVAEVSDISDRVSLPGELRKILRLAATWHDIGKAHPTFQGAMRHGARPERNDLAKGPDDAWIKPKGTYRFPDDSDARPGFRHELASALAMFSIMEKFAPDHPGLSGDWREFFAIMGHESKPSTFIGSIPNWIQEVLDCSAYEFDLMVYLIASRHGKVRAALVASPKDQDYRAKDARGMPIRGIREGDSLPSISLVPSAIPVPRNSAACKRTSRCFRAWLVAGRTFLSFDPFVEGGIRELLSIRISTDSDCLTLEQRLWIL